MKIAIHHRKGSFSTYWIQYCQDNNIEHIVVDAFDNDIINIVKGYDLFIWHHHHTNFLDVKVAKKILFGLEHAGVKVYPDFKTNWHFDDKVAQKYLLEALQMPLINSHVFYNKDDAIKWAEDTCYPKVFKLSGGAGGSNVKLIKDFSQAKSIINKAFGRGIPRFSRFEYFKENLRKFRQGKSGLDGLLKGIYRLISVPKFYKLLGRDYGYVYFQDFIEGNDYDTRVVVFEGKKAIAEKRYVRKNDFRASGSGDFDFENIDIDIIKIAFEVSKKIGMQSVAFDFVKDPSGKPLIVEICYGFGTKGINKAPGYWDDNMKWHQQEIIAERFIIESLIDSL